MKEKPKKSRKQTKKYTYKCVIETIKLVKFELKIPDLLSPLKILHKLNKTRTNCWNTKHQMDRHLL